MESILIAFQGLWDALSQRKSTQAHSDSLCKLCLNVFKISAWSSKKEVTAEYYKSFSDLSSAAQNCYICRQVAHEVRTYDNEHIDMSTYHLSNSRSISLHLTIFWNNYPLFFTILPEQGGSQPENGNDISFANLLWASKLIKTCGEKHASCGIKVSARPGFMPTRLIDLQAGDDETFRVVLCSEELKELDIQYATLSHRWGGVSVLSLSSKTIQELTKPRPISDLPVTFQDAAKVTRHIGLRYIWIDSLCILQDSLEDWAFESSLMSEIYANCYVNIAASAACNPHDGFLKPQEVKKALFGRLRAKCFDLPHIDHLVLWDRASELLLNAGPLARRAWICQERSMSPRTIHFTAGHTFFECRSITATAEFPGNLSTWLTPEARLKVIVARLPSEGNTTLWDETIVFYSKCAMTNYKDKLVALSGLATLVQNETGDQYVAGLWRSQLPFALEWILTEDDDIDDDDKGQDQPPGVKRVEGSPVAYRPPGFTAPSWSWAAIASPIRTSQWRDSEREAERLAPTPLANIIEASTTPVSPENPLGELAKGHLRLSCFLIPLVKTWSSERYVRFDLKTEHHLDQSLHHPRMDDLIRKYKQPSFLPTSWRRDKDRKEEAVRGLIVEAAGEEGCYRRIGIATEELKEFYSNHIFKTIICSEDSPNEVISILGYKKTIVTLL